MNLEHQLNFSNKNYKIIGIEQEFIIHPTALGLLPLTTASLQATFSCTFHIEAYHLFLDKLILSNSDNGTPGASKADMNEKQYVFQNCPIAYNGAVLIGTNKGKEYSLKGNKPACFSYQNVLELVFEDGVLITTIDQSRAMSRVRKNLELGLRSLTDNRDNRCINRFLNSSFIGDYKRFHLNYNRMKYLKEMKADYSKYNLP